MAEPISKTWTIRSTVEDAAPVLADVLEIIQQHGYKREAVFAVRLALDEALVNAVKHGNQNDASKSVHIQFDIDDQQIVLQVEDEGPGFHPADLPDPTAEENLSRPNGRGVMLMRAYMTDVAFNDKGNRVILTKRADCERPHSG